MTHLTKEQLDYYLAHPAEQHPHLAACDACRQQLAPLRATLTDLRLSLTSLADSLPSQPAFVPARSSARPRVWAYATATLALALTAAVPLHHSRPSPQAPVTNTLDDEALLESINQDLSAPLAPSLRPLALEPQATQEQSTRSKN